MKLQHKQKQLIALAIGLVIVVFGLLQALFKFKIDAKVTDEITMVLFVLAFALLFSGRSRRAGGDRASEQTGTQSGPEEQDGQAGDATGGDNGTWQDVQDNQDNQDNTEQNTEGEKN